MTRFMVPFPILFVVLLASAVVFAVNRITYSAASYFTTKVIWSGECTPDDLVKIKSGFSLRVTCGEEDIAIKNPTVILAWVVDEAAPQCEKTREELSGDEQWKCTVPEAAPSEIQP